MRTINIAVLFFASLLLISSCETTEKIDDFPLRPSRLVLNCYFTQDSTWEFQVSKSLSVLDNAELKNLKGAQIILYKGSELIDTLKVQDEDEWYRSDKSLPETGQNYSVEVTAPNFSKAVTAESYLPVPVQVKNVTVQIVDSSFWRNPDPFYEQPHVYGYIEGYFNVSFDDPADEDNYYELSFYYVDTAYEYIDTIGPVAIGTYKDYIYFSTEEGLTEDNRIQTYYFTDDVFDGLTYRVSAAIRDGSAYIGKEYKVELVSLTRDAYLYKKTIEAYENASGDPFAEPVLIYDNIENGYGIFAGFSTEIHTFVAF